MDAASLPGTAGNSRESRRLHDLLRARLLGKHGGPYGTILANDFNQPGMIVVGFKADEVITFLTTLLRKLDGAA